MTVPFVYQGIPNQSTPVLDDNGTMNLAWYRFFTSVQSITGMWALPITQQATTSSNYMNPLIMYRKPTGGAPQGSLQVFDPQYPQSFVHGGIVILS